MLDGEAFMMLSVEEDDVALAQPPQPAQASTSDRSVSPSSIWRRRSWRRCDSQKKHEESVASLKKVEGLGYMLAWSIVHIAKESAKKCSFWGYVLAHFRSIVSHP